MKSAYSRFFAGGSLPVLYGRLVEDLLGVSVERSRKLRAVETLAPTVESHETISALPFTLTSDQAKQRKQWADFRLFSLSPRRLHAVRCNVSTDAAYFRLGFKALTEDGRLFGDASIPSQGVELLVHIGRNDFSRPAQNIMADDVFFTYYINGIRLEPDRALFASGPQVNLAIELTVDDSYNARAFVNKELVFSTQVTPHICHRVAVLAWGDGSDFTIDIAGLSIA